MSHREPWIDEDDEWYADLLAEPELEYKSSQEQDEEHDPDSCISAVLQEKFGIEGKSDQVKAIRELVFKRNDTILIAKTGFGKSVVFQTPSFCYDELKIAIILMPLLALERDQELKLSRIAGCKPFVLKGDTNTEKNRGDIRKGIYTHILTSPEIATSKLFNQQVLKHQEFQDKLCLLAIDEVHLVEDWKKFRPDYMEIFVLRARLPANLPFLGVSATLNDQVIENIKSSCGFRSDNMVIIKTQLDRPEIYIQVEPISGSTKEMKDLHHLLPATVLEPSDIPKTIIFMETISSIRAACKLIRGWMRTLGYPTCSNKWVEMYFSEMSERDKDMIAARFLRRSSECDGPRILICTDAYGLGLDNPDVERVVQYKIPRLMSILEQRKGRAMRCAEKQARYLFLYQKNLLPDNEEAELNPQAPNTLEEASQSQIAVQYSAPETQSSKLELGLEDVIVAAKERRCLREVILKHFNAIDLQGPYIKPLPCCSSCDPDFAVSLYTHDSVDREAWCNGLKKPWFERSLRSWIDETNVTDLEPSKSQLPDVVIPHEVLNKLTRLGDVIDSEESLRKVGGWSAPERKEYSTDILSILRQGQSLEPTSDEVRLAAKQEKLREYNERQIERKNNETSEKVAHEKARNEWLGSTSNQRPIPTKRKRLLQTPVRPSGLSRVLSKPTTGLQTPPSTIDNKENQHPAIDLEEPSSIHAVVKRKVAEKGSSPALRRSKKLQKSTADSFTPIEMDRALQPSASGRNRQVPKRFCD